MQGTTFADVLGSKINANQKESENSLLDSLFYVTGHLLGCVLSFGLLKTRCACMTCHKSERGGGEGATNKQFCVKCVVVVGSFF